VSRALAAAREQRDRARQERDYYEREAARLSGLIFAQDNDLEGRTHGQGI
jgi:hypothetical protein